MDDEKRQRRGAATPAATGGALSRGAVAGGGHRRDTHAAALHSPGTPSRPDSALRGEQAARPWPAGRDAKGKEEEEEDGGRIRRFPAAPSAVAEPTSGVKGRERGKEERWEVSVWKSASVYIRLL